MVSSSDLEPMFTSAADDVIDGGCVGGWVVVTGFGVGADCPPHIGVTSQFTGLLFLIIVRFLLGRPDVLLGNLVPNRTFDV